MSQYRTVERVESVKEKAIDVATDVWDDANLFVINGIKRVSIRRFKKQRSKFNKLSEKIISQTQLNKNQLIKFETKNGEQLELLCEKYGGYGWTKVEQTENSEIRTYFGESMVYGEHSFSYSRTEDFMDGSRKSEWFPGSQGFGLPLTKVREELIGFIETIRDLD